MRKTLICLTLFAVATVMGSPVTADEGMWLFTNLPIDYLESKHGFKPDAAWAEHLMKSCVRFNVGGSASFVSSDGLVLTNHHVGSDTLFKLSTPERNIMEAGFLARSRDAELRAPDLELNQLVNIQDVTEQVTQAITEGMPTDKALAARREAIAGIAKKAMDESGLRSDVVTLFGGARYHLYQYKKYTDVRLVWAPETAAAFMGGDADNFEYPRYCMDACIFRVYENDKPAKIEHFLKWSQAGPNEGELVFVAGNPGRTSRIFTVDALKYQRDVRMPFVLDLLRRREIDLQQFGLGGHEEKRRARDELFGVQNSRKAYTGMLGGLQNPSVMAAKVAAEAKLRDAVQSNPDLAKLDTAWDIVSDVQRERPEVLRRMPSIQSRLFEIAETIVMMHEDDKKPSGERLPEFSEAERDSLLQQLLSDAPIYPDLEQCLLAQSLARLTELRGGDDPLVVKVLNGKSPKDRAAELVGDTNLIDVAARKALIDGNDSSIQSSDDSMIQLALTMDDEVRKYRKIADELAEREKQAYARIAEAQFATAGTSTYPDATFTLRLAFGTVIPYEENGENVSAMTNLAGAFDHQEKHAGEADYQLPKSWNDAKDRLDLKTPMNFVCTADIIGGNSGSPVVNQNLELVGLIFDGNIQSLTADYLYTDQQSRSVSVHSSAIREALRTIYGATDLADRLGR